MDDSVRRLVMSHFGLVLFTKRRGGYNCSIQQIDRWKSLFGVVFLPNYNR